MPRGNQNVVRLHAPLRTAVLADPRAPLPPIALAPPAVRPVSAAAPVIPSAAAEPVAADPARPDPREAENARRLQEERAAIQRVLDDLLATARRVEAQRQDQIDEWRRAAVELG